MLLPVSLADSLVFFSGSSQRLYVVNKETHTVETTVEIKSATDFTEIEWLPVTYLQNNGGSLEFGDYQTGVETQAGDRIRLHPGDASLSFLQQDADETGESKVLWVSGLGVTLIVATDPLTLKCFSFNNGATFYLGILDQTGSSNPQRFLCVSWDHQS